MLWDLSVLERKQSCFVSPVPEGLPASISLFHSVPLGRKHLLHSVFSSDPGAGRLTTWTAILQSRIMPCWNYFPRDFKSKVSYFAQALHFSEGQAFSIRSEEVIYIKQPSQYGRSDSNCCFLPLSGFVCSLKVLSLIKTQISLTSTDPGE